MKRSRKSEHDPLYIFQDTWEKGTMSIQGEAQTPKMEMG